MKRILLDQGRAPKAAEILCNLGWDALHVCYVQLEQATDLEILEFAYRGNWTCITLDHDFHSHLALSNGADDTLPGFSGGPERTL